MASFSPGDKVNSSPRLIWFATGLVQPDNSKGNIITGSSQYMYLHIGLHSPLFQSVQQEYLVVSSATCLAFLNNNCSPLERMRPPAGFRIFFESCPFYPLYKWFQTWGIGSGLIIILSPAFYHLRIFSMKVKASQDGRFFYFADFFAQLVGGW